MWKAHAESPNGIYGTNSRETCARCQVDLAAQVRDRQLSQVADYAPQEIAAAVNGLGVPESTTRWPNLLAAEKSSGMFVIDWPPESKSESLERFPGSGVIHLPAEG